jgi:hypothetical protein
MTLTVTEYAGAGFVASGIRNNDLPQEPALANTPLSSGSSAASSTLSFQAGTRLVRLAANVNSYAMFLSSSAGSSLATSTAALLIPSGQISFHAVPNPPGRLIAFST